MWVSLSPLSHTHTTLYIQKISHVLWQGWHYHHYLTYTHNTILKELTYLLMQLSSSTLSHIHTPESTDKRSYVFFNPDFTITIISHTHTRQPLLKKSYMSFDASVGITIVIIFLIPLLDFVLQGIRVSSFQHVDLDLVTVENESGHGRDPLTLGRFLGNKE